MKLVTSYILGISALTHDYTASHGKRGNPVGRHPSSDAKNNIRKSCGGGWCAGIQGRLSMVLGKKKKDEGTTAPVHDDKSSSVSILAYKTGIRSESNLFQAQIYMSGCLFIEMICMVSNAML